MNSMNVYWFRVPKRPRIVGIAVQPFLDPRDKRYRFGVTGSGYWNLTGKMIAETKEKVVFQCDDSVMGARGGTYELNLLTLEEFRDWIKDHVAAGDKIAETCKSTDDLQYWFRKNWPNNLIEEYTEWLMEENERKGLRTDTWNRADWSDEEREAYDHEQMRLKEYEEEQRRRLAEYERGKGGCSKATS